MMDECLARPFGTVAFDFRTKKKSDPLANFAQSSCAVPESSLRPPKKNWEASHPQCLIRCFSDCRHAILYFVSKTEISFCLGEMMEHGQAVEANGQKIFAFYTV
jgi:hypothetical protein